MIGTWESLISPYSRMTVVSEVCGLWSCVWSKHDGKVGDGFMASEIAIRKRFRKVS